MGRGGETVVLKREIRGGEFERVQKVRGEGGNGCGELWSGWRSGGCRGL